MAGNKRGGCCSWILIPLVAIALFVMIDSCSGDTTTSGTPGTGTSSQTTTSVTQNGGVTTTTTAGSSTATTTVKTTTFSDLVSLSQYLQAEVRGGNMTPAFTYTGNQSDVSGQLVAQMLATYSVSLNTREVSGGKHYTVTVTDYPGDRIVRAYRSGNTSALTAEEKSVLAKAEKIVSTAKAQTNSKLELELALAQWMFDNVTYLTCDTSVGDLSQINRPLTAFGSLMDGSANCQGYSDGFYVLASIAGFEVDRQSMPDHMTNLINLDGQWYVIDVTHCDDKMADSPCYYLFNAGQNRVVTYSWADYLNRRPIAATSSSNYYYNFPSDGSAHGYKKTFADLKEAAGSIVQEYRNGRTKQHSMVLQKGLDGKEFIAAMDAAADAAGVNARYTVWYLPAGNFTYYYVEFQ